MNTNGGRTSYGHAFGASGMADVFEAVTSECVEKPENVRLRNFRNIPSLEDLVERRTFVQLF